MLSGPVFLGYSFNLGLNLQNPQEKGGMLNVESDKEEADKQRKLCEDCGIMFSV